MTLDERVLAWAVRQPLLTREQMAAMCGAPEGDTHRAITRLHEAGWLLIPDPPAPGTGRDSLIAASGAGLRWLEQHPRCAARQLGSLPSWQLRLQDGRRRDPGRPGHTHPQRGDGGNSAGDPPRRRGWDRIHRIPAAACPQGSAFPASRARPCPGGNYGGTLAGGYRGGPVRTVLRPAQAAKRTALRVAPKLAGSRAHSRRRSAAARPLPDGAEQERWLEVARARDAPAPAHRVCPSASDLQGLRASTTRS